MTTDLHSVPHEVLTILQEKAEKGDFYTSSGRIDVNAVLDSRDFYLKSRQTPTNN